MNTEPTHRKGFTIKKLAFKILVLTSLAFTCYENAIGASSNREEATSNSEKISHENEETPKNVGKHFDSDIIEGRKYFDTKDNAEALEKFQNALEDAGDDPLKTSQAKLWIGRTQLLLKNYLEAEKSFLEVLDSNQLNAEERTTALEGFIKTLDYKGTAQNTIDTIPLDYKFKTPELVLALAKAYAKLEKNSNVDYLMSRNAKLLETILPGSSQAKLKANLNEQVAKSKKTIVLPGTTSKLQTESVSPAVIKTPKPQNTKNEDISIENLKTTHNTTTEKISAESETTDETNNKTNIKNNGSREEGTKTKLPQGITQIKARLAMDPYNKEILLLKAEAFTEARKYWFAMDAINDMLLVFPNDKDALKNKEEIFNKWCKAPAQVDVFLATDELYASDVKQLWTYSEASALWNNPCGGIGGSVYYQHRFQTSSFLYEFEYDPFFYEQNYLQLKIGRSGNHQILHPTSRYLAEAYFENLPGEYEFSIGGHAEHYGQFDHKKFYYLTYSVSNTFCKYYYATFRQTFISPIGSCEFSFMIRRYFDDAETTYLALALAAGKEPDISDPPFTTIIPIKILSASVYGQKKLLDHWLVSLGAGWERDDLPFGRKRYLTSASLGITYKFY